MELSKDLSEFIRLMNERGVQYLLVGGWAVGYHSVPRFTGDIDFLIGTQRRNAQAILKVLNEFGFGSVGITLEDLMRAHYVIQLGRPPNRIDLITSIDGVLFEKAWANRIKGEIGSVPVTLISVDDLMKNKEVAARPKDLMDLHALKMVLANSKHSAKAKPIRKVRKGPRP